MSNIIVITGASSGIGQETASILAKDGAKIVLGARREDKLKEVVDLVKKNGGQAIYAVTDVRDKNQVQALAQLALDTYGGIDVWINNAGVMPQAPFIKGTIDEWDAAIDINIKGVLYGITAALPILMKQKKGHIINIASVEGHHSHAGGWCLLCHKICCTSHV